MTLLHNSKNRSRIYRLHETNLKIDEPILLFFILPGKTRQVIANLRQKTVILSQQELVNSHYSLYYNLNTLTHIFRRQTPNTHK